MARIPYPDPATAPEPARSRFAALPSKLNVFRMLLNAPSCFPGFLSLGGGILGRQRLSPRLRELAILRVAAISSAPYEWTQHVPIARACGASEAEIGAMREGAAAALDAEVRDVIRFTEECVREVRVSDDAFAAVATRLSPEEITELVLAIGFYMMVARVLETLDVDAEPPPPELAATFSRRRGG